MRRLRGSFDRHVVVFVFLFRVRSGGGGKELRVKILFVFAFVGERFLLDVSPKPGSHDGEELAGGDAEVVAVLL